MAKVTVEFDSDTEAKTLINVLKANQKEDRIKYGIKIIHVEELESNVRTPTGERIKLDSDEQAKYSKLSNAQRRKAVSEAVFFKAQGTFKGSKPHPSSPFQTAGPFFSNSILGTAIFPGNIGSKAIHATLSRSLNDRNDKGNLGDWRLTHAKKYGGYWSYRLEKFVTIKFRGGKSRNVIINSDYQESE